MADVAAVSNIWVWVEGIEAVAIAVTVFVATIAAIVAAAVSVSVEAAVAFTGTVPREVTGATAGTVVTTDIRWAWSCCWP